MSTAPIPPDHDDRPIPEPSQPHRRRPRTIARVAAAVLILAAALLVGFAVLLHNYFFRQSLLRIALPHISRALGTNVHIRDFSLQVSAAAPSLNIDSVAIDGTSPAQSPLFQAEHLEIGLQIVSMLKRQWYFNNVIMDRPVLRLDVNQAGNTNLPPIETPKNGLRIFDLGIRYVLVRHGELYYNDRRIPLDASLPDVALQARFDPSTKRYSGKLSYQNGRIRFRDWNSLVHSLESEFVVASKTLTIAHCILKSGASEAKIEATISDFAHPKAKATYQALLDSVDLGQVLLGLPLNSGGMRIVGSAQFEGDPNRSVLQALSLDGNMNSSSLNVHTATTDAELRDISADYVLGAGNLDIRNLRARTLDGTLVGSYSMRDVAEAQQSELHAVLRNASLSSIQATSRPATQRRFRLAGAANLKLDATWRKLFSAFAARGSADLKGSLVPVESSQASDVIAVEGQIKGAYSAPAAELTITGGYLHMPKTTVRLSGVVGRRQSLQVQAQSDELHEVEGIASAFGLIREPVELYGAASFRGIVRGSTAKPQVAGSLFSPFLKIKGTGWRMLRATLDANPSHLALINAGVSAADNAGRLAFDANMGLDRWSYDLTSAFQIDLNATRLNISQLTSVAGFATPIAGTLSARVSLHGSKDNIAGQGTLNLNQVTVLNEAIPSLTLSLRGDGDSVRAHLNSLIATGSVQGDVTYFPRRNAYDGQLQARNIGLDQLRPLKGIRVAGALNLTAKGTGSLDDPHIDFTADLLHPQIENYRLGDISLAANIANRMAHIVFDSQAPDALHGSGKVELTGNYLAEASVNTARMPLTPLIAAYLPARAADWNGQIELHARISGPLKNPAAMTAEVTLPAVSVAYRGNIQLANTQPIQAEYRAGLLTVKKTVIRGTDTNVQFEGAFPVASSGSISLITAGSVNLNLVSIIEPDYTSSGEVEFNINGYGTRTNPNFNGQIKIVGATLSASGIPVALRNGNGVLNLVDGRLDVDRFQGNLSNGAFTAGGNITYRPAVQLHLIMAANGIRTMYPPGVQEDIDGNLTLTGSLESPLLSGQVHVNDLSLSQAFNLEEALDRFARTARIVSGASGKLNLDLAVQSTKELTPSTEQLALNGAANLRVRGTVAQPALWGTIRLNSGELLFRGARYILKPSTVDFANSSGIEPRLNIAVETRVKQYNIRILILGPLDELRTTFSSQPPLPSADAINLLIFGQTNQPITTESTGNLGAVSLLASGVTGTITDRLQKIVGISQLSIDPVLDNNEQGSTVGVTVQHRVTANLFVTFTSDPSSTKRQVGEVEYHATPNISVIGVVNQNGGFATDVRIRKAW